eukprot:COSAG01_NODE_8146_length_2904_cov_10.815686_3_plen_183_part_00
MHAVPEARRPNQCTTHLVDEPEVVRDHHHAAIEVVDDARQGVDGSDVQVVGGLVQPGRGRRASRFLDQNRRHIGKSQSKRPPNRTQRPPPHSRMLGRDMLTIAKIRRDFWPSESLPICVSCSLPEMPARGDDAQRVAAADGRIDHQGGQGSGAAGAAGCFTDRSCRGMHARSPRTWPASPST